MIKHLFGRKAPKILSTGIQYADDDHLGEQEHEKAVENESGKAGAGGASGDASYEERKKAFNEKFAASNTAPPEMGGSVKNEANQNRIEAAKADQAKQDEINRQQKEAGERKKEGGNVKQILESKRAAEKERDDLKAKAEEFETKTKPELDKKIADLEAKIASGDFSSSKEKEFQDKITLLEKEKQDKEETLVNENKKLKDRLKFYDLQNDECFDQEYVQPVREAHKVATEILGGDQQKMSALHRALLANQSFLRAGNDEERRRAMVERNQIISSITEGMDEFAADTFKGAIRDYIKYAEKHAIALQQHEKTTAEIREKSKRIAENEQAQVLESWQRAYKTTAEVFKPEEQISEDEAKLASELGFDVKSEMDKSNVVAHKVITGQSSMMDAINMVHQGRIAPVLRARNKVLEKQLADRDAIIAKLRKSGTGGGESNGSGQQQQKEKPEKQTREEWQSKFSANRPGVRAS